MHRIQKSSVENLHSQNAFKFKQESFHSTAQVLESYSARQYEFTRKFELTDEMKILTGCRERSEYTVAKNASANLSQSGADVVIENDEESIQQR